MFKRYSEIRALYKELKIIYENRSAAKKKFPRFAKGHYFGEKLFLILMLFLIIFNLYNSWILAASSKNIQHFMLF